MQSMDTAAKIASAKELTNIMAVLRVYDLGFTTNT